MLNTDFEAFESRNGGKINVFNCILLCQLYPLLDPMVVEVLIIQPCFVVFVFQASGNVLEPTT